MAKNKLSKEEIKKKKSNYMLNTEWRCEVCDYKNYRLAGKTNHLKTQKHKRNEELAYLWREVDRLREIDEIENPQFDEGKDCENGTCLCCPNSDGW